MSLLSGLRVGTRLIAGFSVVLALLVAVAVVGHFAQLKVSAATEAITEIDMVGTELLYQTMNNNLEGASWIQKLFDVKDPDELKRMIAARSNSTVASNDRFKKLESLQSDAEGKALLADLLESRKAYTGVRLKTLELLSNGANDDARAFWKAKGEAILKTYREQLDKNLQYFRKRTAESRKQITAANQSTNTVVFSATVLAVLLGLAIAWFTTGWLKLQLGGEPADAMGVANRVAAGDLTQSIALRPGDSISLMAAMSRMQTSIKSFVAAQVEMKARHDEGLISHRIDASTFNGSYADMAKMTNELVASHIAVKMRLAEVAERYGKGDLSVDMDKLPGEKARLTVAMDGAKANLQAMSEQIQGLVAAAGRGDYSARGDASKFEYEFRKMVEGMNQLMQTSDTGLKEVSQVLSALAKGDLTERMTQNYQGAFGKLKVDANQTVDNLTVIVNQIKEASETIATASKEITQGNSDLSQRTEEQASSLQETASSMEELTSTVKQNAENARQANQLAVGASDVAVKGGDVVKQVVTTMSGISASSKKIADIIGVIDGIAFQTNILALNAAVEAARAGEQGRGFAVVATEVRNLAQRSANAAKEIKELITDSVSRVDAGTELVDQAGLTMEEIVTSVKRVTDIMAEITAASQEQSSGIEQVNQAITQMDEVTQQNAALVEQAAAAAESMQEQAGNLVHTVGTFNVAQTRAFGHTSKSGAVSRQPRAERKAA